MARELVDASKRGTVENDREEFLESWAKKYFDTIDWIEGAESGGIDPPRNLKECFAKDDNTVIMRWNLPPYAGVGIANPPYHVTDYARIRTDELVFEDGRILENGRDRFQGYEDDSFFDDTKDMIVDFQKKYAVASKVYDMKHSADPKTIELAEKLETLDVVKDFLEYPVGVFDNETKDVRLNYYTELLHDKDLLQATEADFINRGNAEAYKATRQRINAKEKVISAWEEKLSNVYSPKDVVDTKRAFEEEKARLEAEFAKWNNPSSDDVFADFE